jgi:cellulose synthase/poly-beta-1,6-N-acetylglucosamine synthase-like glycosyltransferase
MNKTFSDGHEIITGYRNSKNYGDNWISAGYALWFLRESRYLNQARMLLNTSCAVSGTGFLFSTAVLNDMGGWPFHLLTEDMEFTVDNVLKGRKIGFCKNAVLYDEQPVTFRQSWHQRMRWSKGFLQVFGKYGNELLKGTLMSDFSCFDMTMSVMPAIMLTVMSILVNTILAISGAIQGEDILIAVQSVSQTLLNAYLLLYVLGAIATISEWKNIHTSVFKKILYTFTFPLFMFTYIPISFSSLFTKVEWKPIKHNVSINISDYEKKSGLQKKRV